MHKLEVPGLFDAVCYWNGFGVGSDADQRLLLNRVGREWLRPGGVLLMHVYPEPWWVQHAGNSEYRSRACFDFFDYDPVESRLIHSFTIGDRRVTESIRCYSPADLRLLIEPTGLTIVDMFSEVDKLAASWKYGVVLRTGAVA